MSEIKAKEKEKAESKAKVEVKVKEIKYIDGYEARVVLTDEEYNIECYCKNCFYEVGDIVSKRLMAINVENIKREKTSCENGVVKDGSEWGANVCGKLCGYGLIKVGEIVIDIDDDGGYISFDDNVSFHCDRLEI